MIRFFVPSLAGASQSVMARIGLVLYSTGCILFALVAWFSIYNKDLATFLFAAIPTYLLSRGLFFIFAGK